MMSIFKIKKNTNYIFIFGSIGSGKSTLMATIAKYFSVVTKIQTNPKNKEGGAVIFQWITDLDDNKFPERSRVGDIYEIDIAIGKDEVYQITFLEMAGEDLEKVDVRKNKEGELGEKFIAYAKQAKVFLLITDTTNARKDDILINQFLSHVQDKNSDLSRIALIICKWDALDNNIDYKEFIGKNMPMTRHWLEAPEIEEAKVFTFSVGKVVNNKLIEVSFNDTKPITKWLVDQLD